MRKLARLAFFFSVTFVIIFAATTSLKFLALRVDWAINLPPRPETVLTLIIAAAHWALSLTLFSSILVTTNYIVRKKLFPITSIFCVMLLAFGFSFVISFALEQWKSVPPAQTAGIQLGEKGMIISNLMNRNVTAVVLLEGTANPHGPRVMAIPNQPLAFHEALPMGSNLTLPPVPFADNTPWFLNSLGIDIRLNAEVFQRKFSEGFFYYLFYAGALIFLLCSLGYVIKFSAWPLANLFIAMLIFRGILAITTFFNTPEMQITIESFLNNLVPVTFALPLIFLVLGVLVQTYSILGITVKRRVSNEI
ncbi:MAG: hypothetical protein FWC97_10520 [Treponema sp.]|nr:hypothetical protein [Treponema sp.]